MERRCEQSALVEEARSTAIRQQTSLKVAPLSDDSKLKIAAVGAAAAKAVAERAGNSQYNELPLGMFIALRAQASAAQRSEESRLSG